MRVKNRVKITNISLNEATFHSASFSPSNINFFFGKNGTGKSTIGRVISEKRGLTWKTPTDEADTLIQLYNEEYIRRNIQTLEDMPGVFNISEVDIEVENSIREYTERYKAASASKKTSDEALKKIRADISAADRLAWDKCWEAVSALLEKYKKGSVRRNSKQNCFVDIFDVIPVEHTEEELAKLYSIAFDASVKPYPLLKKLPLDGFPTCELLGTPIISKDETQFSRFLEEIGASDWVRDGHLKYEPVAGGLCPFCQQPLTEDIVTKIADCFNRTYEDAIHTIERCHGEYEAYFKKIQAIVQGNYDNMYPEIDQKAYGEVQIKVQNLILGNMSKISMKLKHPSQTYILEDIRTVFEEFNAFIDEANALIQKNNDLIQRRDAKGWFNKAFKEHLAFLCKGIIELYRAQAKRLADAERDEVAKNEGFKKEMTECKRKLSELAKHSTSTKPVIDNINALLEDSNFQGFSIVEGGENRYKLVRPNGEPAYSLSEGEKNFICFLYFYFSIFGSFNETKELQDRVIVIDDPVSSMDSDAVFIISYLIRHLIEVTKNAFTYSPAENLDTHIKQIYILTHNSFFYNEIAPLYLFDYECASYFEITKEHNISAITPCEKLENAGAVDEHYINYIPKLGSYSALWEEYREATSPNVLMSVIRRILEAYFLQNLGITPGQLYKIILDENKDSFAIDNGGKKDYSDHILARSMLCYIATTSNSMNSSLYFTAHTDDLNKYRSVFQKIFEVMQQGSHYKMMMGQL